MKNTFFKSVSKGAVGDGTAGPLQKWIAQYVKVLFPENRIEYWSDNQYSDAGMALKEDSPYPTIGFDKLSIHHIASYVRTGSNEGRVIEVGFFLRNGAFASLAWAKSFGSENECWQIAHAVSVALESIFFWGEVPDIVFIADKVPRKYSWHTETSLTEKVLIDYDSISIEVRTESGIVLDKKSFALLGESARHAAQNYAEDWGRVLANAGAQAVLGAWSLAVA